MAPHRYWTYSAFMINEPAMSTATRKKKHHSLYVMPLVSRNRARLRFRLATWCVEMIGKYVTKKLRGLYALA